MQASWMSLHGKRLPVTGSADPFLQPLTIPLVEARQVDLPLVALDSAAGMGRAQLVRRARLLAWAGLGWHAVEAVIAVIAGLAAGSIALVGFGADSVVEGIAGVVVLWRFTEHRTQSEAAERRAQQLIGISFYAIAAYVAVEAIRTLAIADHPEASWVGIGLAAVTLSVMPALAAAKARVGDRLGSSATKSEGRQNLLCAYLSAGLLVGLAANAFLGWWWADPVTAFLIAAVAVNEGREAWRGEACCDAC
jgi:divalent metal cation (Fe/Co/Zn/Cd) transporter